MPFTALTTSETDADSPLDTALFTKIKDNFSDLDAARVTNGDTHDHSGGDGAVIPQGGIGASSVGQVQLKMPSTTAVVGGTVNPGVYANFILTGGLYSFYPQIKHTGFGGGQARVASGSSSTFMTHIALYNDSSSTSATINAQSMYIQASPPYMIGSKKWGHFLFLLRKISTGEVVSWYEAEDPCWAYNGLIHLPKDHPDRCSAVPHPFVDYYGKSPSADGLEIVLVDVASGRKSKWVKDTHKSRKHLHENLPALMTATAKKTSLSSYGVPTIPKFTDSVEVLQP